MQEDKKEWSPRALRRLLAEVEPHHVDPGKLGEYVSILQSKSPKEAERLFPDIARHIQNGCQECLDEIDSIRKTIGEETCTETIPGMDPKFVPGRVFEMLLKVEEPRSQYGTSYEEDRLDWLVTTLTLSAFDRESPKAVELPASWAEELFVLASKLPANERKRIASQVEEVVVQLRRKKEELQQQAESIDEIIDSADKLLSAIQRQRDQ